ncbi:MAG: F0F1 ATP synthase subunit A, partial [Bacilli bacterium]
MNLINWYLNELSPQVYSLIGLAIFLSLIFVVIGNYFKKLDATSIPNKRATVVMMYYDFIDGLCTSVFRNHITRIKPFAGTLFLLIIGSNYLPLFLPVAAPTTDYNVPLGLVIISMTIMYSVDFKYNGVKSHIKGYFEPLKVMFPLNLMGIVSTPLSM